MHFTPLLILLACGDKDSADGSDPTGTDPTGTTPPCAASVDDLASCVDGDRYQEDLEHIAEPRLPGDDHWQETQDLCAETFAGLGLTVELDEYGSGVNVIGRMEGSSSPDELVVVAAHYDSVEDCPGADDNGSGLAGVFETARVLTQGTTARTVLFACWDEEERGLVGSKAWADAAADRGDQIVGDFTYEMIGYRDDAPDTQELPLGFDLLFPDQTAEIAADEYRGDFIALIGDPGSAESMDRMSDLADSVGVDVVALEVPDSLLTNSAAADLQRSDHAPFWQNGYPAIQITDTANFRNLAYHCWDGEDVPEILDQDFARGVIAITTVAAGELAGWEPAP